MLLLACGLRVPDLIKVCVGGSSHVAWTLRGTFCQASPTLKNKADRLNTEEFTVRIHCYLTSLNVYQIILRHGNILSQARRPVPGGVNLVSLADE